LVTIRSFMRLMRVILSDAPSIPNWIWPQMHI